MLEEHVVREAPWLTTLIEDVVLSAVRPHAVMGQLGYQVMEPGGSGNLFSGWQVSVYPVPGEFRGQGALDGARFVSGFSLDIVRLLASLSDVEEVCWHSPARYTGDLDGPGVSLVGKFAGRPIRLRVFNVPPPGEEVGFYTDPRTGAAIECTV